MKFFAIAAILMSAILSCKTTNLDNSQNGSTLDGIHIGEGELNVGDKVLISIANGVDMFAGYQIADVLAIYTDGKVKVKTYGYSAYGNNPTIRTSNIQGKSVDCYKGISPTDKVLLGNQEGTVEYVFSDEIAVPSGGFNKSGGFVWLKLGDKPSRQARISEIKIKVDHKC